MTDQGEPVDAVYLDYSKAFDWVCHHLLIKKMEAVGINPKINRWVGDFLKTKVKLGDHHSSEGKQMEHSRVLCSDLFFTPSQ